jgi:membrane-bound lytic murein transglycosylase D
MTAWVQQVLMLSGLSMVLVLPVAAGAQTLPESSEAKESLLRSGANGELGRGVISPDSNEDPNEPEDRLVILPEIKREGERYFLSSFKLPDKLTFAGQPVPLDNWQVRERIEYEFYQFLEDQGESIILAKRTGRCFPPAEKQLAEAGLPDDLKYMLLVESKCVAAAYSKAKASGPWQFIPSTGRRYRLKSDAIRDDRRNLEMSTEAAVKYLRYLKDFKENDWFMAMASYNAGEERVRKLLKDQNITDYWKMHGPRETMRYVPRIIAAKEIYSQPEKYLGLSKKDLYLPVETETVTVNVKDSQRALTSIAEEFGTYFLELKMLNPEFKKDVLPRGTYQMKVPRMTCPNRCFTQDKTP